MTNLSGVANAVLDELRERSKKAIYQRDPEAWYADVLDGRWWSKQKEVVWSVADPDKPQTMTLVKSCNGIGKTRLAADLATWYVATQDPAELSVLITAPIFKQVKTGLFRYIADNYGIAKTRGIDLPGRITAEPALKVLRTDIGLDKEVIQAKRPADSNLISSFQGIHDGLVVVLIDEAGGIPEDLWIGANAVTTNEYAKILAIGNPDARNNPFFRRFTNREQFSEWNPITISAYDSPNLTGEIIYPDNPEKDKEIKSHLTQRSWVEMMERQAHPNVVRAKVYGEFPDDDDTSFFPQSTIDKAFAKELDPHEDDYRFLGVDLAFSGADKTVAYLNHGGQIRKVAEWLYDEDYMKLAQRIHQLALTQDADQVRVDAGGTGHGIYRLIDTEIQNKPYLLFGIQGGKGSPDTAQWAQARAWHYDTLRRLMREEMVDLDPDDKDLRDELITQTYDINNRGAIQMTGKKEARARGLHSPDHLDAVIYSAIELDWVMNQHKPGDKVYRDPDEVMSSDIVLQQFYADQRAF